MKASLTESDYQLIQKLEIKRAEEQKEPLTALKIAKVLTQYHNNNDTNGQDNFELSTVNRVECDTEDIANLQIGEKGNFRHQYKPRGFKKGNFYKIMLNLGQIEVKEVNLDRIIISKGQTLHLFLV